MGFMGANWIKNSLKKEMSPLGESVADLLGDVFLGIYHLDFKALNRVCWEDDYVVIFVYRGDLATVDFNQLTRLVVLAHDRMLRISIEGVGPGYMKLIFHQRHKRTGSMSERCPTIEEHIKLIKS